MADMRIGHGNTQLTRHSRASPCLQGTRDSVENWMENATLSAQITFGWDASTRVYTFQRANIQGSCTTG